MLVARVLKSIFFVHNAALASPRAEEQDTSVTGDFMATRMLYSMVAARVISYPDFLTEMDPSLRRSLTLKYLMDFIHSETGTALPQ